MPVFFRRSELLYDKNSKNLYRELVREDFFECCAYCLLHEVLAGGMDNFELDHFYPKSKLASEEEKNDYYNLYYSCHICNKYKADSWPNKILENEGYRYVDLCKDDFKTHFKDDNNGNWIPLTNPGKYTDEKIRLNRKHLVEVRKYLSGLSYFHSLINIDWDLPLKNQICTILDIDKYKIMCGK